jgi:septal ring factor EnvC (AmiA/AmiB activator)
LYPTITTQPTIPSGPSQAEYSAAISQAQEKDYTINQLQSQINEYSAQFANLNAQVQEKDNTINQLTGSVQNLQATLESYQSQINQLNNEKAQLQGQIPQLQNQLSIIQQENMTLQQQIGPLQAQINKLQEELAYRDKRIQELKEPKAVMPSSLAQGVTSQTSTIGSSPTFGPSTQPTPSPAATMGSGRRLCPNCGASGFAIKEVEDKTKILSYIPKPQYAKKNVCTKCGFEF